VNARWLVAAGLLAAPQALAESMPNDIDFICHLHHAGGIDLNSITKLPPSLKSWIAGTVGPMSDRNGPFNPTDVILYKDAPAARFIRAGRINDNWFLWYEHGGVAHTKHIVLLHLELELTQIADKTYTAMDDPCPLTDALLDKQR
jgi:hypothetical protein